MLDPAEDVHPDHDPAAAQLRDAAGTLLRLANTYMGRPSHSLSEVEREELQRAARVVEDVTETLDFG